MVFGVLFFLRKVPIIWVGKQFTTTMGYMDYHMYIYIYIYRYKMVTFLPNQFAGRKFGPKIADNQPVFLIY